MKRLVVIIPFVFFFVLFSYPEIALGLNLKIPFPSGEKWQISSGYGPGAGSNYHDYRYKDYYALDFNLPGTKDLGKKVVAAESGKIKVVYNAKGYGNYALIDHGNGYSTRYAHLSKILAKNGSTIKQGEIIGEVGMTGGTSTGPHLHFVLYKSGKSIKPEPISGYSNIKRHQWLVSDNESPKKPVSEEYLLTFHSIGKVKIGDSIKKVEEEFGEPESISIYNAHNESADFEPESLDLKWEITMLRYKSLDFHFSLNKLVYFEVNNDKYKTHDWIGVNSLEKDLLKEYSNLIRDENFNSYFYKQMGRKAEFFINEQGKIDFIIVGLEEFIPSC